MSGWKTWAGGISAILSGIALILHGLSSDPLSINEMGAGAAMVSGGLATLGIGHKIEKAS